MASNVLGFARFPRVFLPALSLVSAALLGACGGTDTQCSGDQCGETRQPSTEDDDDDSTESPRKDAGMGKSDAGTKTDSGTKTDAGGGTKTDAGGGTKTDAGGGTKTDAGSDHTGGGSGDLPCEIASLLESRCGTCHGESPTFGAPQALVSAADFQAKGSTDAKMADLVKKRISETDPRKAMPPASSTPLTAAEKKTLTDWLTKGAPAGDGATCGGGGDHGGDGGQIGQDPDKVDTSGLECYKMLAHSGDGKTPYKVGVATDAYFNFTFKAPWTGMAYGIVFKPIIDNMKVIHHWLLFQDDKPGAPSGAVPSIGAHPGGQLLNGWAPGGQATDFRAGGDDVGVELPGTTSYTVEFHYNSADAAAKDASGVEICVQKTKPKNIAGLSWLGLDQLLIPAQKWVGTCKHQSKEPIHIVGVTPHMHKEGTYMKATINRANGTKEILHDKPFDFNYQIAYDKNVIIQPGDSITTECTYAKPMAFGESTNAEMCYLFTMAYPKGALKDSGLWGSIAHGGSSCLGQ